MAENELESLAMEISKVDTANDQTSQYEQVETEVEEPSTPSGTGEEAVETANEPEKVEKKEWDKSRQRADQKKAASTRDDVRKLTDVVEKLVGRINDITESQLPQQTVPEYLTMSDAEFDEAAELETPITAQIARNQRIEYKRAQAEGKKINYEPQRQEVSEDTPTVAQQFEVAFPDADYNETLKTVNPTFTRWREANPDASAEETERTAQFFMAEAALSAEPQTSQTPPEDSSEVQDVSTSITEKGAIDESSGVTNEPEPITGGASGLIDEMEADGTLAKLGPSEGETP